MDVLCRYDEMVALGSLQPHEDNPNVHPDDQIERLSKLYESHGIRHPIIVSRFSGKIVAGHGRLMAALRLNLDEFPVEYQEFPDEEAEYLFMVSDNAIQEWSELKLEAINHKLQDLGPDTQLEDLGIKDFKLDLSEDDKPKKSKSCPHCGAEL